MLKLHLGCQRNPKVGYVNVDIEKWPGVDVVADLEKPWPWEDGSVDEVFCADLPEHLRQWWEEPDPVCIKTAEEQAKIGAWGPAFLALLNAIKEPKRHYGVIHFMEEAWRVLRVGGLLDAQVPTTDGYGAWQDPTHVSYWNPNTILYWQEGVFRDSIDTLIRGRWTFEQIGSNKWPNEVNIRWMRFRLLKRAEEK